jgi:hypothetical protein
MALFRCPDCFKEISDKAFSCINCGYPIKSANDLSANVIQQRSVNHSNNPSPYQQQSQPVPSQYNYAPSQEVYYQQVIQQNEQAAKKAANTSLTCGIVGLFFAGLIFGIIAISQGNKAKRLGYTGKNASTGITLGIISIIAWALIVYFWIL